MTRTLEEVSRPVRLDLNVAPFLNEEAVARALRAGSSSDLAAYPEPGVPGLERAIADGLGVEADRVLVGNGSDEVLDLAMRTLVPPNGSIGVLDPGFGMYDRFAAASRLRVARVRARGILPVDALASLDADAYFLASPNNPTGETFPREAFESLAARTSAPVVLDEAYAEFARQDLRPLARDSDSFLVTRTFSKAFGLPGIRVGYAVGPGALVDRLRAIRMPYNVSSWSERVARAALDDPGFVDRVVAFVEARRAELESELLQSGWPVWPSRANFLFVGPLGDADRVWRSLREAGVLVKLVDWPAGREGQSLRVSVGTGPQNAALLAALREVDPRRR
jgi:histidinol-phosphate aminotransferase